MVQYQPIGVINTPHKEKKGTPIQPPGARDVKATVKLNPEYTDGLKDLGGFTHITLVYHFHKAHGYSLQVQPYMGQQNAASSPPGYLSDPTP
jgi:tRNA (Thr-GGU) A37 N-methylase